MRKAFLERTVIELVYRFDEKFIEKVNRLFNFFSVIYIHTYMYIHMDTNTDHKTPAHTSMCRV